MSQMQIQHHLEKYIRKPYVNLFCPGCGESQAVFALLRAIDELGLDRDKVVIVCGIGCHNMVRLIADFDVASVLHGRSLPFATGLKLANPELTVIAFTGDGDGCTIGGNHLIHAARRNIGITHILLNNFLYANTGGQVAATTPLGAYATTSPYGNIEQPFDVCALVASAGASYVARGTTYHMRLLINLIKEGIAKKGFSFIECICQCPTIYGVRNNMRTPVDMIRFFKQSTVTKTQAEKMNTAELKDKIVIGKFVDVEKPEFTERMRSLWETWKK